MLPSLMHSFVGQSSIRELCPPALVLGLERERAEEEKKREVLHLFRCYTHTHAYHTVYIIYIKMYNNIYIYIYTYIISRNFLYVDI